MRPHLVLITLGTAILAFAGGVELGAWRAQTPASGPGRIARAAAALPAPGPELIPDGPAPRGTVVEAMRLLDPVAADDVDDPAQPSVPAETPAEPAPAEPAFTPEPVPEPAIPPEPPVVPVAPAVPQVMGLVTIEAEPRPVTTLVPVVPEAPPPDPLAFEPPPTPPTRPNVPLPVAANVPTPARETEALTPAEAYGRGLAAYEANRYAAAEHALRQFLVDFPDSPLAENARYWIAECRYSLREFAEAAEEFALVAALHPAGNKAPDALLKEAYALGHLGRGQEARVLLRRIVLEHAGSRAAVLAEARLDALR